MILLKSQKHTVVAWSNTEAKYLANAHATCELLRLKNFLQELHFCEIGPRELAWNNHQFCSSPPIQFFMRTRHIEVGCHFLRENILSGIIKSTLVDSKD